MLKFNAVSFTPVFIAQTIQKILKIHFLMMFNSITFSCGFMKFGF